MTDTTKRRLKKDLLRPVDDMSCLAKKGDMVDTYRRAPGLCLWINVGNTHTMVFKDEEEDYFDDET